MWSCPIEILNVSKQDTMQMFLVEYKYVIQALSPDTPQKAFTDRIGSWCVIGRFQDLDAACCCNTSETGSKLAIIITDEILRRLSKRCGLPQLLCSPSVGGERVTPTWITFRDFSSIMKNAKSERKKRSVTWRKSQVQISPP
jgi:hypothetical protein